MPVGWLLDLSLLVIPAGCWSPPPPTVVQATNDSREDGCAVLLESGVAMIQPDRLGIQTSADDAANNLTQWLTRPDCLQAVPAVPLTPENAALLERLLGSDGLAAATANEVTPADAEYIRDVLLDFPAAEAAAQLGKDDVERAVYIFSAIVREITAPPTGAPPVPLSPHESRLLGWGNPADRAWIFANLLRQLKIDAVILQPAAGGDTSGTGAWNPAEPWWVGVLLDDGVYLFDPAFGMTVPPHDATIVAPPALMPRPITWTQAVANPELLTQYRSAVGVPVQPITADRLRSPRIGLIAPAPTRKLVMGRLEQAMPSDRGVLLFDPVQATPEGTGLFRRVADAGAGLWETDAICVWPYPDQQLAARGALTQPQRQFLLRVLIRYQGPLEIETNDATKQLTVEPSRRLWETRLVQLAGRSASAIGSYLLIRTARNLPPELDLPAEMRAVNAEAADEAFYQVAQCQFAVRDFAAAAKTLQAYFDGGGGNRNAEAAMLLALSISTAGGKQAGLQIIPRLPPLTPNLAWLRWLAVRWSGGNRPMAPASDSQMPDTPSLPEDKNSSGLAVSPSAAMPVEAGRPATMSSTAAPASANQPPTAPVEAPRPAATP